MPRCRTKSAAFVAFLTCLAFSPSNAELFSYRFTYPDWDVPALDGLLGTYPIVEVSLDNGSDSITSQSFDLSTDVALVRVFTDDGTFDNTWLGSDLLIAEGMTHNYITTDVDGNAVLDLTNDQDSRIAFSNPQGTWQFATNDSNSATGFTYSWLATGPNFDGDRAIHLHRLKILLQSVVIPEPHAGNGLLFLSLVLLRKTRKQAVSKTSVSGITT